MVNHNIVLIVAKCIVNFSRCVYNRIIKFVLIVAKCIVNILFCDESFSQVSEY